MKKVLKFIRNILIIIVILIISLFAVSKVLEDKIIEKTIEIVNSKVTVPISVNEVQLSLFHSFPHLTVDLKQVKINSPSGFNPKYFKDLTETHLAELDDIYISFNLESVLSNSFDISKISLSKGIINVLVNKKGIGNYEIFKPSDSKDKSAGNLIKEIDLKSVQLNQVKVNYVNLYKNIGTYTQTRQFSAKGKFVDDKYSITTRGSIQLDKYTSYDFTFIPKSPTSIKSNISISNNILKINSAQMSTKGIQFNSIGTITFDNPVKIDMSLSGDNISVESLIDMIPTKNDLLQEFDANGLLEIDTRILGSINETVSPRIKTVFGIKEGYLLQKKSKVEINDLSLNGSYNNYAEPNLSISDFSFQSDSSSFKGKLEVKSIENPVLSLKTDFRIDANDIYELFLQNKVDSLSGKLNGQIEVFGKVPKTFDYKTISSIGKRGVIEVDQFKVLLVEQKFDLKNASGLLTLESNNLSFKNVKGQLQKTNLKCDGKINNLLGIFYDTVTNVTINGHLQGEYLDFSNIEHWFLSESDSTSSTKANYIINSSLRLNKFKLNNFYANNMNGNLAYGDGNLVVKPIHFEAFEGKINSVLNLKTKDNNTQVLQTLTNTYSIEISDFFTAFDNFNQSFITDKNIFGKVTSSFESEIDIVDGKFVANSLDFLGHINIVDGRLIDFEPAQKLSAFSDIDDLRELSFNTIDNDILINRSKVTIPKMEIGTNVMDISIFGEQEFSGDYEYHIKLLLSDLLHKKSKRVREKQSEFGAIEDDGLGKTSIYLVATGSDGETKIKFDREELRSNLSNNIKEERQEIKKVLNKEFGWFKKDSTIKQEEEKPQFQIEWEEE